MPFIEAFRQFQFRVGRDNFCVVHVSLIPEVGIARNRRVSCSFDYNTCMYCTLVFIKESPSWMDGWMVNATVDYVLHGS